MRKQTGGASLFIVIFSSLMITVVTIGFSQIMLRNQEQALAADLSQSAYDAAMAGVEDAKRLMIKLADCEAVSDANCSTIANAVANDNCKTTIDAGIANAKAGTDSEVQVGDSALNQSYTCVKIKRYASKITTNISSGQSSKVLMLHPRDADAQSVTVYWFNKDDAGGASAPAPPTGPVLGLPSASGWGISLAKPPMMRAQYIPADSDNDDTLDSVGTTIYGYPKKEGDGRGDVEVARRSGFVKLSSADCRNGFTTHGSFACKMTIDVNVPKNKTSFLILSPIYAKGNVTSDVSVTTDTMGRGTAIELDGVPVVDSTGRTAERFRRVRAQLVVGKSVTTTSRPIPKSALSTGGDICKAFFITNNDSQYNDGKCTP